jgi:hypothetical protein
VGVLVLHEVGGAGRGALSVADRHPCGVAQLADQDRHRGGELLAEAPARRAEEVEEGVGVRDRLDIEGVLELGAKVLLDREDLPVR